MIRGDAQLRMSSQDRDAAVIEASGLFDRAWYLNQYPDVAASGMDPLLHYLRFGARMLRNPGPHFDARRYRTAQGAALADDDNPLVHYLTSRARNATPGRAGASMPPMRIAIKIAAPNEGVKHQWGDYHFAVGIKRALERLGHDARIDLRSDWEGAHCGRDEVVVALRGRVRYKPSPHRLNLMWNISHPADVMPEEYEEYDHVFVASLPYADELSHKLNVAVTPLLQCTDPELFNAEVEPIEPPPGVLFVGNSRGTYRQIVKDAIEAGASPEVYGQWRQFLPEGVLKGTYIPNDELARYYRSCRCLLNDHWDDMRAHGFISNRLFDAVACGARVVSDSVEGMEDIFDDAVSVYEDAQQLPDIIRRLGSFEARRSRRDVGASIRTEHTFDARVGVICDQILRLSPQLLAARP